MRNNQRQRIEVVAGYIESERKLEPTDDDVEATCRRKFNRLENSTAVVTPESWLELAAECMEAGFYVRSHTRALRIYELGLTCRDYAKDA